MCEILVSYLSLLSLLFFVRDCAISVLFLCDVFNLFCSGLCEILVAFLVCSFLTGRKKSEIFLSLD